MTNNFIQFFPALVLTTILFLGSNLTLLPTARAIPGSPSQSDRLPPQLAQAVLQDLSRKVRIPVEKLKITSYTHKTWSDGCLGLPRRDEFCTQVLVPGWRITLSNNRQTWIYRSDRTGRVLRLEPSS